MAQKEEVILEIKVDQDAAQTELERAEKAILDTKKAMADLNKTYKEGKTSQEDFVKESLRMQDTLRKEGEIKKTQIKLLQTESNSRNALRLKISQLIKEMDNLDKTTVKGIKDTERLQKEIAELVDELNKGSKAAKLFKDNIGNYAESILEAAKDIQFAGTSIGSLTALLGKVVSPAGAAAAAITALGAAYVKSAAGAEDLRKAQNNITALLDITSNSVGNAVGGGVLENLASGARQAGIFLTGGYMSSDYNKVAQERAKAAVQELETQQQLELAQIQALASYKVFEKEAEDYRKRRDDAERSFQDRQEDALGVEVNMIAAGNEKLLVLEAQRKSIWLYAEAVGGVRDGEIISLPVRKQLAAIDGEIRDIQEDINGQLTENLAASRAITKEMETQAELDKLMADNARRTRRDRQLFVPGDMQEQAGGVRRVSQEGVAGTRSVDILGIDPEVFEFDQKLAQARMDLSGEVVSKIKKDEKDLSDFRKGNLRTNIEEIGVAAGQAATLFEEQTAAYKIFASAETAISAWTGAQKTYESYAGLGPAGVAIGKIQYALALAQGLASVAQINGIGFASGGFTGSGFGSPDSSGFKRAGIVHEGEYVTPKRLVNSSAAQPHIQALERMRMKGYADGGLVTNNSVMDGAAAVAAANAAKNIPPAQVSVVEIMKVWNQIQARENKSRV